MQTVGHAVLGTVWEFDAFCLESRMRLCFGDLTLDLGTRQLLRENQEIRLSPKAFELDLLFGPTFEFTGSAVAASPAPSKEVSRNG